MERLSISKKHALSKSEACLVIHKVMKYEVHLFVICIAEMI